MKRGDIMVIGEGITEFYYFQSLKDVFKNIQFNPGVPKHSSLSEIEKEIKKGIDCGYSQIFCIIDMDNKSNDPERRKYLAFKEKYSHSIINKRKGINCSVSIIETYRCTELFFLYYFKFTTKDFYSQDELIKELNKSCHYKKTKDFFKSCKGGLHKYFEGNGGSLKQAINSSNESINQIANGNKKNKSYSELGQMLNSFEMK